MRTYVPSNCGVEQMKLRTYLPIKNKYQINDVRTYPLPDFLVNVLRTYPGKGIDEDAETPSTMPANSVAQATPWCCPLALSPALQPALPLAFPPILKASSNEGDLLPHTFLTESRN